MNLMSLSLTHQKAQLKVRERLAFPDRARTVAAYDEFRRRFPGIEAVILSTCNRVELYAAADDGRTLPTTHQVAQYLSDFHQVPLDEFVGELETRTETATVEHLYEVVASLDSMVLGEPQIVSQVKEAYRVAEESGTCGPLTHALFQTAIRTSGRIRTETKLSEGRVSIASVAVGDFGKSIFDHFGDKRVLIIGAGEMAEETLRYLKDEGIGDIVVVNRSRERAEKLATDWGGFVADWDQLDHWLGQADVIVSTTGADRPIVTRSRFKAARRAGGRGTAFILDLGAPRDFEPTIGDLDDVFLYDIDSLRKTCDENRAARTREIERAQQIVEEEVGRFLGDLNHRASSDIVARLREGWHDISRQELERLFRKVPHLTEEDRKQVELSVARIVNKLLHPPLEALRDEAVEGAQHGLVNALRRLFRL